MDAETTAPRITRRAVITSGAAAPVVIASAAPATASPLTAIPIADPDGRRRPPHRPVLEPPKYAEAVGGGGAVSSVDPYASEVGIQILAKGGNAVDAAIAMAATLGVTEPFSCGIGGGGFLVYHHAKSGKTFTINGRETAPASYTSTTFTDSSGAALDFDEVVNSGLSVGVPGTVATWEVAARRFGRKRLGSLLRPATEIARRGFIVDAYYRSHTASNAERFAAFPETVRVFLPGGAVPEVGSVMRNPDLADTYERIAHRGVRDFHHGRIARAIVDEARNPSTAPGVDVRGGQITLRDLARFTAPVLAPTTSEHRGLRVHGMSLPSSGGIAVGQILNLVAAYERRTGRRLADLDQTDYLHWFSEASATAFADRNRWVGDVRGVPIRELLSTGFARERALLFDPDAALARPIPFGSPDGDYEDTPPAGVGQTQPPRGQSTTHLNATDRWGNVVSYTLTIEQTGGSGITVPGHGFLLNNELTDFNFVPITPGVPDPNLPGSGKRPRSSMSPTIILDRKRPRLSVGTPGGATIITTVAQIILGHIDRGLPLVEAIAAARLSSRNGAETADGGLVESAVGRALIARGHNIGAVAQIGNASGIDFSRKGRLVAAAETSRGDGGAARVLRRR